MQLILAFLEPPAPAAAPWDELAPQARAAALETSDAHHSAIAGDKQPNGGGR